MWMTRVTLYLSFLSTLFCLILWLVLLRMAAPEKLLLLVTGGLGMQMAGQSVGHALREMMLRGRSLGVLVNGVCEVFRHFPPSDCIP